MVKTAIENKQNMIVEGCYIPADWKDGFDETYLAHIRCHFLVMSERYIKNHFADIKSYASVIEKRLDDTYCTMESVLEDNAQVLASLQARGEDYILIDDRYEIVLD